MQFMRLAALGAVLVMLAVGVLACADDDGDDGSDEPRATSTTGSAPRATSPTADADGASGDEVTITAEDFSFSPAALTINGASDTTITLNNTGDLPHALTIYYDEGYTDLLRNTGNVSPGASGELTIESDSIVEAPDLFFRCSIHPQQMQGTITVEGLTR
jgi:plastocyanin